MRLLGRFRRARPRPTRDNGHSAEHWTGGAYIEAPDSGEPWPEEIWQEADLDEVGRSLESFGALEEGVEREERERHTSPSGFYIPRSDREVLKQISGPSVERALRRLNER